MILKSHPFQDDRVVMFRTEGVEDERRELADAERAIKHQRPLRPQLWTLNPEL